MGAVDAFLWAPPWVHIANARRWRKSPERAALIEGMEAHAAALTDHLDRLDRLVRALKEPHDPDRLP